MLTGHDEELADHAAAFADVFLHELGAGDADKLAVCVMGYCSCEEGFSCARGTIEEDAFGLGDAEGFEKFGVFEAELDDLFYFFNLLVQAAYHVISAVGDFFDHHEGDKGVNGGGEHLFEFVAVGEESDALADGKLGDVDGIGDINHW